MVVCTPDPQAFDGLVGRAAEGLFVLAEPFDVDRLLAIHAAAPRRRP